jgi:predicted regulator of Ras-like GTPase activity (Roadblock/LC7/MglB family)
MFKETLKEMVHGVEGGRAAVLMGYDGLAVDQYSRDGFDIETLGAELTMVLKEARKAALALDVGQTREVSFRTESMTAVVRMLNDEYFLVLALSPNGNHGKGRYLMRLSAPRLLREL